MTAFMVTLPYGKYNTAVAADDYGRPPRQFGSAPIAAREMRPTPQDFSPARAGQIR